MSVLFCFTLFCLALASPWSHDENHNCIQHCEVKMPVYFDLRDNSWIWNPYPGYCAVGRPPAHPACFSNSPDGMDYCKLTQSVVGKDNFVYRCNVYNSTTGTFFFSGNIWPEYVACKSD